MHRKYEFTEVGRSIRINFGVMQKNTKQTKKSKPFISVGKFLCIIVLP